MPTTTVNENSGTSIDFEEIADGNYPHEKWGTQGFEASRMFKVAWADRVQFVTDILGDVTDLGSLGDFLVTQGEQYPAFPQARAESASIRGYGKHLSGVPLAWTYAMIGVDYRVPDFGGSSGGATSGEEVLISESLDATAEFLTLPHHKLFWTYTGGSAADPVGRDIPLGRLLRMVNWNYTIHHTPRIPMAILSNVGQVNNAAITSPTLGLTWAAGTILYNGPRMSREITRSGARAWTLDLSFTYRPVGWNNFPKGGDSDDFAPVYDQFGNVVEPYPTTDLSAVMVTS